MNPTTKSTLRCSRPLLLLNIGLLVVIGLVCWSPSVQAQLGLRSHYLMVAGDGESEDSDRVWMLDTREINLAALQWNTNGQGFRPTASRSVKRDIENILKTR